MLEGISKPGWDPEYDSLCVNCIVAHIKWTPHTVWVSLVEDLQCLNRKLLDIGFQLWLKFVMKLYLAHMNSNAFRTLRVRGGGGVLARRERGRERLQLISGANHLFKFFCSTLFCYSEQVTSEGIAKYVNTCASQFVRFDLILFHVRHLKSTAILCIINPPYVLLC